MLDPDGKHNRRARTRRLWHLHRNERRGCIFVIDLGHRLARLILCQEITELRLFCFVQRFSSPAFFSSQATGKPLSETEQAELTGFLGKYKTSEPVIEINDKDAAAPFVTVKVPQAASSAPVVFTVRIQHK